MSTEAQINANRQNAQKSTGPKTAEGKAAVSQNALKHGLFAAGAVISVEDPADYELYRDEYLAELLPVGMTESVLAERIVSLAWRLQRAERMQNEYFDDMIETEITNPSAVRSHEYRCDREGIESDDPRYASDHLALGRIATSDWSGDRVIERLMLYERRIENSLYKTLNRLKQYQVIRRVELDETGEPSAPAKDEAAVPPAPVYNLSDLKKQSQFAAAHLSAKPLMEGDYGNKTAAGVVENKANQSQFPEPGLPNGAGKGKKTPATANSSTG